MAGRIARLFFAEGVSTSAPVEYIIETGKMAVFTDDAAYVAAKGSAAAAGDCYYNSTANKIKYYNGTIWLTSLDNQHSDDATIHFAKASISHTEILDIGTNSHSTIDSHIGASAAHGTTGNIVGTSDTQSLSNKSFTDPITFSELSTTPTTPASGKQKIYPKDDGKFYRQDSSGKESLLGAGGGGVDFLSDVEATSWLSYKDAAAATPVDGVGGTATIVSVALEEDPGDVLSDGDTDKTFVITKASGNGQGEGIGIDFSTRGPIDFSAGRLIKIYAITSADYNDDDFRVYVYDTDNDVLIDTFQRDLKATLIGGEQIFQFQTRFASADYRLIFHCASTNTDAYTIKLLAKITDSGMAIGSPITDWVAYTPQISVFSGTVPSELVPAGKWRRVGANMEIHFYLKWTASPANPFLALYARVPAGYDIDFAALATNQSENPGERNGGIGSYRFSSAEVQLRTKVHPPGVGAAASSSIAIRPIYTGGPNDSITIGNITELLPDVPIAGDMIIASISVPISGWSSNVVMSETMPGRDVVLVLEGNGSAQTIPYGIVTNLTNWAVVKNPANIWDATNGEITIPESGYYSISGSLRFSDTDGDLQLTQIVLRRNGSSWKLGETNVPGTSGNLLMSQIAINAYYLQKGEVIAIKAYALDANASGTDVSGSATAQVFSLAKLNTGNQTIGLEETVLQKVSAVSNPNLIINGGFDLWQRGTSQTTSAYGSDDRWVNNHFGSTKTASRQTSTDTERSFFSSPYYSRTVVSSSAGASNRVSKFQQIEDITKLAGKTVTLSFWAKADASKNIAIEFTQSYGTGGSPSSGSTGIGSQKISLTTTWEKNSITVAMPSLIGKTLGTDGVHTSQTGFLFWFDAGSDFNARTASLGQQSGTFDIAEVKLEIGSVATPFSLAGGNIAGELAMAQRYYEKGSARLDTYATSGNNESINVFYKVTKRISVTPSVTNTSVVNFNATPNVLGLDEGKFSIYHTATATGGANFADAWEANAEF